MNLQAGHLDLAAAGFQLAMRLAQGPERDHQARTFRAIDDRVKIIYDTETGIAYAQHTEIGINASGSAAWVLEWTPNTQTTSVILHVAANAAYDDASEFGDYIYADDTVSIPTPGASTESLAPGLSADRENNDRFLGFVRIRGSARY